MTVASSGPEKEPAQIIRFSRTPHTKTTWKSQGQNHNVPFCNLQCPITPRSDESCSNDITCSHTPPHNLSRVHCPSTARDSEHGAQPTFFAMLSLQKEQIRTGMITLHAKKKKKIFFSPQTHSASKVISNLSYSKTNRQGKALSTQQHTLPDPMQVSRHEGKSNKALALIQKEGTGTRCKDRNQVRARCK